MDILKVVDAFSALMGLTKSESMQHLALCSAGAAAIQSRLKNAESIKENEAGAIYAAACESYYNYILSLSAADAGGSFKAGDLSVTESSSERISAAKQLRDNAVLQISNLMGDCNFDFRTVETQ